MHCGTRLEQISWMMMKQPHSQLTLELIRTNDARFILPVSICVSFLITTILCFKFHISSISTSNCPHIFYVWGHGNSIKSSHWESSPDVLSPHLLWVPGTALITLHQHTRRHRLPLWGLCPVSCIPCPSLSH